MAQYRGFWLMGATEVQKIYKILKLEEKELRKQKIKASRESRLLGNTQLLDGGHEEIPTEIWRL